MEATTTIPSLDLLLQDVKANTERYRKASFADYLAFDKEVDASVASTYYARLKNFIESIGWKVLDTTEQPSRIGELGMGHKFSEKTSGQTDFRTQEIWIRGSLSPFNKMQTLVHEMTHTTEPGLPLFQIAFDVDVDAARILGEIQAESVVFLIDQGLGLPSGRSPMYLAHNHQVEDIEFGLQLLGPRATRVARSLLAVLEPVKAVA
jgi:hypothetical protein